MMKKREYIFILWILCIVAACIMQSCITEKKRAKICATCPVISKDSTVYIKKDTTIYINSIETVFRDTIICDSTGKVKDATFIVNEKGIKHKVIIKDNKIISTCKADSLEAIIKGLITERSKYISNTKIIQIKEPLNVKLGIYFVVSLIVFLFYLFHAWKSRY